MHNHLANYTLLLLCLLFYGNTAIAQTGADRLCGKWESRQQNLRVSIYTDHGQFKAKIIWFANTEGKPMDYWRDVNNPDPKLRSRTLLGMSILSGLQYDPSSGSWENGTVYDSRHGRYWNVSAYIGKMGLLHVRGYWHFKWIGKTMTFHRVP